MATQILHPTMRPVRLRDETPVPPSLRHLKRNHPSWRGRYVHAPRSGFGVSRVTVKNVLMRRGFRGFRSMRASTGWMMQYLQQGREQEQMETRPLYTPEQDRLTVEEQEAFRDRARQDAWQWHFVVSPEQAKGVDLPMLTRDLMRQVEQDTDYRLDWVAANHYNTVHPHSHVLVRGRDMDGQNVGFKRDYLHRGMAYRAQDLATEQVMRQQALERTPVLERDREHRRDISQEHDRG